MTKHFIRQRIESPGHFSQFRIKKEKSGDELVVGKLKPKFRKKGYSAWHLQAILHNH